MSYRLLNMTEKKDPNKQHFFQVASHAEFTESMLAHCSLVNSPSLTIWEKGENEDQAEIYGALEYFPHPKIIKLKPTGKLITKITGSTKASKQVLIKIPIKDKVNYFTGGHFKFHPEDLTYTLEIQQEIYKSQARENFRLTTSEAIPIQFKIDDQVFEVLDISVSGTCFIIDSTELERFSKGKIFPHCTLRFDRKNYHIPMAQVVALIALTDELGHSRVHFKVGILFKELPQSTEDELYVKISTEARGEEMKKKFNSILSKKLN